MTTAAREYASIAARIAERGLPASRAAKMQIVVDALWEALRATGVSWIGFYLDWPEEPDDRRLVLGPCRDKPACSPIGMHGACGQALGSGRPLIVRDVRDLGANYVACDPRDRSELVVPCFDESGGVWGVLDLDSWELDAFDGRDVQGLDFVLRHAGLSQASVRSECFPQR